MSRKALLKRRPRKIDFDGDEVWVRSPTLKEGLVFDDMVKIDSTQALRVLISQCVVKDAGGDAEFSGPDDPDILDIPVDSIQALGEKIKQRAESGTVASAEKN